MVFIGHGWTPYELAHRVLNDNKSKIILIYSEPDACLDVIKIQISEISWRLTKYLNIHEPGAQGRTYWHCVPDPVWDSTALDQVRDWLDPVPVWNWLDPVLVWDWMDPVPVWDWMDPDPVWHRTGPNLIHVKLTISGSGLIRNLSKINRIRSGLRLICSRSGLWSNGSGSGLRLTWSRSDRIPTAWSLN